MPRTKKDRCCRDLKDDHIFKPKSIPNCKLEQNILELDEFEAIRLCDYDELSQIEAAQKMGISRGTVQRLLNKARKKIVDSLLYKKSLIIKCKKK